MTDERARLGRYGEQLAEECLLRAGYVILERNWRGYRGRDVVVVGVDIQDKREAAEKFVSDFGLTFPIAQDLKGTVSVDYGVYGVPETFFVDRQGRIRVKHVGAVTDEVFRKTVDTLLAEKGTP